MEIKRRAFLQSCSAASVISFLPGVSAHASTRLETRSPIVESLLSRMTVEEKVGQLTLYPDDVRPTPRPINPDINAQPEASERARYQLSEIRAGRVGALLAGTGVAVGRKLQEAALQSRLGIPLMFGADVLHGLRTIFPLPLALAASFEPELAERTARAAAEEMTAVGVHWTYAPMVDVARDQRWGRVAEGSGEDPYLTARFSEAYVRGFQGSDLKSPESVAACPKHFAGYGAVSGGMDYNSTDLTERELRQTHLPAFKAAFDAGALTTMAAFNDIDGVPASGNRHLLTEILRSEWGFSGFVTSDAASAEELVAHGFASGETDAAIRAFSAGVDVNMGGGLYKRELGKLVSQRIVSMALLDESVRRVLRVKEALGLFDNPFRSLDLDRERTGIRTPTALALSRHSAVRSVVLLKNDNAVLPLSKGKTIALVGPLGDDRDNVNGTWAPWAKPSEAVTLAQGLREAIGAEKLIVAKGSHIEARLDGGLQQARAAASAADVVILALGEAQSMSGEAASRAEIVIPAPQQELADEVSRLGKPVVVVLSCGRALALQGSVKKADAILVSWFLGSEAGRALTDILVGKHSPSGRLPVSFPQLSGQQPWYYNHKSTGRPEMLDESPAFKARYTEITNQALYPFGYGLTYSSIEYSKPVLDQNTLPWDGLLQASVTVRNNGDRLVDEVVQLYIRDVTASVTRPVRELKAFRKVRLQGRTSSQITFSITRKDLEFVGTDLRWRAEPGNFKLWLAPSSTAGEPAEFDLEPARI